MVGIGFAVRPGSAPSASKDAPIAPRLHHLLTPLVAAILLALGASASAREASLALVLAIDVSASVSADSYVLQYEGIARAFEGQRLAGAIAPVPGGIEALVLEWSDPDKIVVM